MAKEQFIGEFELGPNPSDGEISCDGMTSDGHTIRKGAAVYYKLSNVEHHEYRPACRKHAKEEANYRY